MSKHKALKYKQLSKEQQDFVDAALSNDPKHIELVANARTGKTAVVETLMHKIYKAKKNAYCLYINKYNQEEMAMRLKPISRHARAFTLHSLAYKQFCKMLGISYFSPKTYLSTDDKLEFAKYFFTIEAFSNPLKRRMLDNIGYLLCCSSKSLHAFRNQLDFIAKAEPKVIRPEYRNDQLMGLQEEDIKNLLLNTIFSDPDKVTHDLYFWFMTLVLKENFFKFDNYPDYIVIDEYEDLPNFFSSMLRSYASNISAKLILVGDTKQAVYSAGISNFTTRYFTRMQLQKSWTLSPAIAKFAYYHYTRIVPASPCGNEKLLGLPLPSSMLKEIKQPLAILVSTNILGQIILLYLETFFSDYPIYYNLNHTNAKMSVVRTNQLFAHVRDGKINRWEGLVQLLHKQSTYVSFRFNKTNRPFHDFKQHIMRLHDSAAIALSTSLSDCQKFKSGPCFIVTTIHKSRGFDFESVAYSANFSSNQHISELHYVATTRTRTNVYVPYDLNSLMFDSALIENRQTYKLLLGASK